MASQQLYGPFILHRFYALGGHTTRVLPGLQIPSVAVHATRYTQLNIQ